MDRKALVSLLVAAMLTIASFSAYVFILYDDDDSDDPNDPNNGDPIEIVPFRGKDAFQEVPYKNYFLLYYTDLYDVCYYTDDFFRWPSTAYDHSLAVASCCFARTIFSSSDDWENDPLYVNGEAFLEDLGFGSIEPNEDFYSSPELDTIGAIIGKKTMTCDSKDDTTVIALGIRGDGYGIEWASNFLVGTGEETLVHHKGFYDSQTKVMDFLKGYIADQDIKGDVKLWITGFSRGAAVSNLTAGILDTALANGERPLGNDVNITKEDIYAYTMGTPAGVYYDDSGDYPDPHSEDYDNIWSILVHGDMVPKLMLEECGFHRYGNDIVISDPSIEGYDDMMDYVVEYYNSVECMPDIDSYFSETFKPYRFDTSNILDFENIIKEDTDSDLTSFDAALDLLFDKLSEKMGGREGFMEMFQEDLTEGFEIIAGESRSSTLEDFFITLFPMLMEKSNLELIQLVLKLVNGNDFSDLIEGEIREALILENGYADRAGELADRLCDIVLNLRDMIWDEQELMDAVATIVMNAETIVISHNFITYHGWLKSTDPNHQA